MIMLVGKGEVEHARAVHEVIGKLLTSSNEPLEARRTRLMGGTSPGGSWA
jgi:hypothetical protein